jgi:hypothetical protein
MAVEQVQAVKIESLYTNAARHGLIVGAMAVMLSAIAYATSLSFLGSIKYVVCAFALYIGYVIYAGISYRNRIGRYISYRKAYVHGFIVLATAGIVNVVFGFVLYDIIDPDLATKLPVEIIANTEDLMRSMNAPESTIDETISDMKRDLPGEFTVTGRIKNFFTLLIYDAVILLITSLIVRKNEPVGM